MDPSPKYRISTITATGSVNTEINLDLFYDALNIIDNDEDEGVVYVEYGKKKSDTVYKGFSKKFLVNKRKVPSTTKRFDNQVTIVYRRNETVDGVSFNSSLNIKVFKNGNVQITGIKFIEQGSKMIDTIIGILRSVYNNNSEIIKDPESMMNKNYSICLINSDFRIGFAIKRDLLYKIFTSKYDNDCSFEPCIYPGVKMQYFYNSGNKHTHKDGLCHCDKPCLVGKGNGREEGSCKKITIAVFQSGCVIITGAQSHDQINESHDFITSVLNGNRNEIEKKQVQPVENKLPRKVVMINKKNIVYPSP